MKIGGTDRPISSTSGISGHDDADGFASVGDLGGSTMTGTSTSPTVERTSSSAAAPTSTRPRSRAPSPSCPTSPTCVVVPVPTRSGAGGPRHHPADRRCAPPSAAELAAHCRARLAPYKVPKSWEMIDEMPRNSAGKVRRSALAAERRDVATTSS